MRWSAPYTLSHATQAKGTPASRARSSIASPSFGLVARVSPSGMPAAAPRARGAPGRVAGPALGQVEGAVDQRLPVATGVAEEHADLAVLDAARRAAVLPLHPGRLVALLEAAGLVDRQSVV